MRSAPIGSNPDLTASEYLEFVSGFANPDERLRAAARVATLLGAEQLHLYSLDPELDVLLPAPGLPQSLPQTSEWRPFLQASLREGAHSGSLPLRNDVRLPAVSVAQAGTVAVLLGGRVTAPAAESLRPILPLLGALFTTERRLAGAESLTRSANEMVERSRLLARALGEMRERLERALQETEEARAAADEANRAKSEFLANMSHELRTPINAVLGYEELLAMELAGPLNKAQLAQLERIRSSSQHLLMLINDILDLAKVEAGQLSIVYDFETLEPVLEEAISLVQMQFEERGVHLTHACPGPTPAFYGDRDRARQIVVNLLSNAVKFTEPGGTVTVSCGTTEQTPPEAVLAGSRRWTYVQVEDNGIGISAEDGAKIFQPFGQVEQGRTRKQGGTGLGLTISRHLARLMGGDLTLESEVGVGSRFTLFLPVDNPVHGELDDSIRVPDQ